jgi:cyanophycinase
MKRARLLAPLIACACVLLLLPAGTTGLAGAAQGRGQRTPEFGPPSGALVIVGGAMRDPAILQRFLDLAGGPDAPIVVIPTAGGGEEYDEWNSGLQAWKRAGATDLTVLHTTDRAVADSAAFVAPLTRARGVWFNGGRQWRLADAYLNTRTHDELWKLLERGGVIGGSSAGATIQGEYLARGDTSGNTIMMGDHTEGLGFLKGTAIDQHVLMRNRQFDLIEIIEQKPELLGIGLDENTAIVVRGDTFEVMGQGYVLIHDANAWVAGGPAGDDGPAGKGGSFYFLAPGDRFDMRTRQATRPGPAMQRPIDRVGKKGGGG